jgi:NADP-dependent 3-hydroxy acid dehydrogenase YdfG
MISSVAGRFARAGSGVYNMTKFGVNAFSEALRQEVTAQGVRVTVVEPGAVSTELVDQNRPEIQQVIRGVLSETRPIEPQDIADAIVYALSRPPEVSINEVLVRPTSQTR